MLWQAILWSARSLVAVLIGAGLIDGARTVAFVFHSAPARGHVVSRSEVDTYYPLVPRPTNAAEPSPRHRVGRSTLGWFYFVPMTTRQVEVQFVDREGVTRSQYIPESMCWRVDESNIPIRMDSTDASHVRVDTFYSLWAGPTLFFLSGLLAGAFVEYVFR